MYLCVFDAWVEKTNHVGRQVQTKETGVDHEIGEETGAAENLIFLEYIEKYEFGINQHYEIGEETGAAENIIFLEYIKNMNLEN